MGGIFPDINRPVRDSPVPFGVAIKPMDDVQHLTHYRGNESNIAPETYDGRMMSDSWPAHSYDVGQMISSQSYERLPENSSLPAPNYQFSSKPDMLQSQSDKSQVHLQPINVIERLIMSARMGSAPNLAPPVSVVLSQTVAPMLSQQPNVIAPSSGKLYLFIV